MIRWATEQDRPAILDLLQKTGTASRLFSYADCDGLCLLDEDDEGIRGFVLFSLGRPTCWIRALGAIRQHPFATRRLMRALVEVATSQGCQGVDGFVHDTHVMQMLARWGWDLTHGVRARLKFGHPTSESLLGRHATDESRPSRLSTV